VVSADGYIALVNPGSFKSFVGSRGIRFLTSVTIGSDNTEHGLSPARSTETSSTRWAAAPLTLAGTAINVSSNNHHQRRHAALRKRRDGPGNLTALQVVNGAVEFNTPGAGTTILMLQQPGRLGTLRV
jgi:hypothetical protein